MEKDKLSQLLREYSESKFNRLRDYYDGRHDILDRTFDDATKPNNKIISNFCKVISNSNVNHFIGKPVSYSAGDGASDALERLTEIFSLNNEQNVNAKLAKYASIYSKAYELLYTKEDENGKVYPAFTALDPRKQGIIIVRDNTVDENILEVVRFYNHGNVQKVFVYDEETVTEYDATEDKLEFVSQEDHYFGEVPIVEYNNKEEDGSGDFEDIMRLNDAYNILLSDDINESEYSNDAYLIIKGMDVEESELDNLKEKRAITVQENGDVHWLMKDINNEWKTQIKELLRENIFTISGTPDMTDDKFAGNSSGVALKYKLLDFENNRSDKERMFKVSLQKRIRLIFNFLKKQGKNFNWRDITLTFSANLPNNLQEEVEMVEKLAGKGVVSNQTLRTKISFVEDPEKEEDLIKEEEGTLGLDTPDPDIPEDEYDEEDA